MGREGPRRGDRSGEGYGWLQKVWHAEPLALQIGRDGAGHRSPLDTFWTVGATDTRGGRPGMTAEFHR